MRVVPAEAAGTTAAKAGTAPARPSDPRTVLCDSFTAVPCLKIGVPRSGRTWRLDQTLWTVKVGPAAAGAEQSEHQRNAIGAAGRHRIRSVDPVRLRSAHQRDASDRQV